MSRTYQAILKGDHVQWLGEAPDTNGGVPVEITVVDDRSRPDTPDRRKRIRQLLESLASSNPFSEIADPVAWQREIRRDRPLPGREGDD